ncbi:MAG: M48 family metallopeptidase [Ardenticatenaceae bacterium]|nr:M48 family metallopeptidase [Ardenticatenaceae bacterium]
MSQQHQLQFGESLIEYEVTFATRKTLAINVHPDLSVTVVAPQSATPAAIEAKVRQRAPWILRQQQELELYLPQTPPRQYVSGETHRYLGRQYRLKVSEDEARSVKLTRGFLTVMTPDKANVAQVQSQVEEWYRVQAKRVFPERLAAMLPRFARFVLPAEPQLAIRKMQSRWGSCTEEGVITLNLKLMQVPKVYIDYVIVHELCHLIEHNHSTRFYGLLDRMMPDWRTRRERLNGCEVG